MQGIRLSEQEVDRHIGRVDDLESLQIQKQIVHLGVLNNKTLERFLLVTLLVDLRYLDHERYKQTIDQIDAKDHHHPQTHYLSVHLLHKSI